MSPSAQAQIPAPIKQALQQANVSNDDFSLVIIPIASHTSQLPEVIVPKKDTDENSDENDVTNTATDKINSNRPKINSDQTNSATQNELPTDKQDAVAEVTATPLATAIRHYAKTPRTPASTMKLIPTFIGLDILGADFTWFTKVYHTGIVIGDTLYGDLIIKASGDPKLTHKRLKQLLYRVQQTGIHHINGDLILDTSIFQNVGKDPAAFDDDPLRPYNVSPDGMLINFNSVEITTVPSVVESYARLYYTPGLADYNLPASIGYRKGGCRTAKRSIAPVWQNEGLLFQKSLPAACGLHRFYVAYPDVKDFSKRVIKQQWLNLGNTLAGDVINTEQPRKSDFGYYIDDVTAPLNDKNLIQKTPSLSLSLLDTTQSQSLPPLTKLSQLPALPLPLVSYPSLPLSKQIYDINHYSNNVMTEQLLLSIAAYEPLSTPVSNNVNTTDYPQALSKIEDWWQTHLQSAPPKMNNGSGLCRNCKVTANNLAELLSYAYHQPNFDTYVNSLGVAGISGTIKNHARRLPNSTAIGRAWIKTGTLDNVTAMAGYIRGQSGQDYVVVGIINTSHKLHTYKARIALDTMLDWTAKH